MNQFLREIQTRNIEHSLIFHLIQFNPATALVSINKTKKKKRESRPYIMASQHLLKLLFPPDFALAEMLRLLRLLPAGEMPRVLRHLG